MFVAFDDDLCEQINEGCREDDHRILEDLDESADRVHELGRYLGNILHGYYGCDVLLINVGYLVSGEISGEFAGLLIEYYRDPESTAKVWEGGYYHTGDIAWRDEDGYYWYVGRKDDVIKSSGYRIGPFEVESAMLEHDAVVECAITGAPDPVRGQVVKATVVLKKNYKPSPELIKELQDHVKKSTAPYKYPRIIEFVDEIPKTISGKIKRAQIRHEDEEAVRVRDW